MRPFFALLPLALTACISFGPKPPRALLTLTPTSAVAVDVTRTAAVGQVITIAIPVTPAAIATPRIPVYATTGTLAYVVDAAWNDAPARLFQRLLSETVTARTQRVVLDLRQSSLDPGIRLSGTLQQFGIDPQAMEAVVTFDGVLARADGSVVARRFTTRAPLTAVEPFAVGIALNAAANAAAVQIADWTR